eukprot:GHVS01040143.1.p1 GENE.GHVS01040143.1~~GHVS01040143.1.p1  ORF type:complete len:217 (+),score=29.97 GHVS01040143.1:400-1050(+)
MANTLELEQVIQGNYAQYALDAWTEYPESEFITLGNVRQVAFIMLFGKHKNGEAVNDKYAQYKKGWASDGHKRAMFDISTRGLLVTKGEFIPEGDSPIHMRFYQGELLVRIKNEFFFAIGCTMYPTSQRGKYTFTLALKSKGKRRATLVFDLLTGDATPMRHVETHIEEEEDAPTEAMHEEEEVHKQEEVHKEEEVQEEEEVHGGPATSPAVAVAP